MIALLQAALLFLCPALLVVAALKDLTSYTIPNWISLALIVGFFPAALALGMPWASLGLHVGIGVAALIAGMAMFALGWIGGGDAKVFAATALWLGWPASATFLLVTALAGGVLALTGSQDLAHDDFGDFGGVDAGTLQRALDGDRAEIMCGDRPERPVEGADRRTGGGCDDDIGHSGIPPWWFLGQHIMPYVASFR